MRIAMAQIDPFVGDLEGNTLKICEFVERAKKAGAELVVFPELSIMGYPPRDLLDKRGFVSDSLRCWERIAQAGKGIGVIFGAVSINEGRGKPFYNSAVFYEDGRLRSIAHKMLLPSYDVFDEERYFEPGKSAGWVDFRGKRIGVTICEDAWNVPDYLPGPLYDVNPVCELGKISIDLLVNISASPYHVRKTNLVGELLKKQAACASAPLVYVNQVGGNDELIFQGHSMIWDEKGRLLATGADFAEDLILFDTEGSSPELHASECDQISEVIGALTLGLRDYARKCSFDRAVIGLSGGVDSAVVACLAVLALGAENVLGVAMPGPYNAPESLTDARELARRLGIGFEVIPIGDLFSTALKSMSPIFGDLPHDFTEENLQARLRGMILMSISNKFRRLLLSTGNKSEISVGYCTLYGDMNGGLAVLGDVPKTMVYGLAGRLNEEHGWIPDRILTRAPSAELRENQTDQDTLPPYEILDAILSEYVEQRLPIRQIVARGFDPETVRWVARRVELNEYKRWQAPPILRVTTKAFGMGRRNPIAHGYVET
ncbi:MAG: NAD+ synthase [Deltaproteobacteria bacterium]|jgi:NAD+ synthetase|nr:NAD+ synthase [Deltaproteobacteria bacterium]